MNEYLWKLYLKAGGKNLVDRFEDYFSNGFHDGYEIMIQELMKAYTADSGEIDYCIQQIKDLCDHWENSDCEPDEINDLDADTAEYMDYLWDELLNANDQSENNAFLGFICNIYAISNMAAYDAPEIFIPYYFITNYNVLEKIADAFEIELPSIPNKKDYKGRFYHYGEICKCLVKYRKQQGWTPYELYAFLYDFAPKYIGGIDSYIVKNLPEPRSAYFIGGAGDNDDAVAEDDKNKIIRWQCNPETRAGDMIVMYLRSPISAISSVWRSCSVGFIDPFFYYYRCTFIMNPIKVKRIDIKSIKKDAILSQMPIVSGNMQGINGVELKPSEYNHILDISKAKGVERLSVALDISTGEYENEKAVEEGLIKPLILRLGYKTDDYIQQLNIPVGNHNHLLIPDFIIEPRKIRGFYTCSVIIEAKRSIKKEKELTDALGQARSYALQLGAAYSAVASQEKIWVTSSKDGYTGVIKEYGWDELQKDDVFAELRGTIGNKH